MDHIQWKHFCSDHSDRNELIFHPVLKRFRNKSDMRHSVAWSFIYEYIVLDMPCHAIPLHNTKHYSELVYPTFKKKCEKEKSCKTKHYSILAFALTVMRHD